MDELPLMELQFIATKKFDLNNISFEFIGKFIHNSLSFETDFVTLDEVNEIVKNQHNGIESKKVLLVENHMNALMFVVNLIKEEAEFNENKLKDMHEILMNNVGVGGLYRNVDISIKGSNHTPPSHIKVYDRMKKYFNVLEDYNGDVFELLAFSHLQLDKIHPFLDGNGRCARLVLTYHLLKFGLIPIIFPHTNKSRYFGCLEEFKVNKNIIPFIEYIKELEYNALGL